MGTSIGAACHLHLWELAVPEFAPADVMILFADIQDAIVGRCPTNDEAVIRKTAGALAQFARALSIPCLASVIPFGGGDAQPIDEIRNALPDLPIILREGPSVFAHAPSREAIIGTGRTTIAIAGLATEIVVLHAALAARDAGMDVHVLLDASGGFTHRTEMAALREMESAGIVTSSMLSFATRMADTFASPEGQAARTAVESLML